MIKVVGILIMISIIIVGIILYNLQNVKSRLIGRMIVLTLFLSGISIGLNYLFPETTFPFVLPLLVVLAAFVFCAMIWEAIQYPKTVARIIKQFTLPNVLSLLLVGSALFLTARLDLIQYILYCIGILGAMIFVLLFIEAKKKQKNHEISLLADIPVESKEELVPSRQQDLIHIKRLLEINNYREPFALMINDDWGTGKTSLINVLMKDLEEEGHYIIFMQPMVWDDQHKMMDYFFSQLESLLYEKGIYTGKNSAFERYANLITQTLNTAHQSAVYGADLWKSFLGNQQPTNYREQKKQLEEDISLLLGEADKHIYLIVDDCDRVDEGVFKQVLMFIKEVVNFRGIDVLFLMDERKVAANDATLTPEYLEKFVNERYSLSKIEFHEVVNQLGNEVSMIDFKHTFVKDMATAMFASDKIINEFDRIEHQIESTILIREILLENQKYINEINLEIKRIINNPRKTKLIINKIIKTLKVIDSENETWFLWNLQSLDVEDIMTKVIEVSLLHQFVPSIEDYNVQNWGYISQVTTGRLAFEEYPRFDVIFTTLVSKNHANYDTNRRTIYEEFIKGLLYNNRFADEIKMEIPSRIEGIKRMLENLSNRPSTLQQKLELLSAIKTYKMVGNDEEKTVIDAIFDDINFSILGFELTMDSSDENRHLFFTTPYLIEKFIGVVSASEEHNKSYMEEGMQEYLKRKADQLKTTFKDFEDIERKLNHEQYINIEDLKRTRQNCTDLFTRMQAKLIDYYAKEIDLYNQLQQLNELFNNINPNISIEDKWIALYNKKIGFAQFKTSEIISALEGLYEEQTNLDFREIEMCKEFFHTLIEKDEKLTNEQWSFLEKFIEKFVVTYKEVDEAYYLVKLFQKVKVDS